MITKLLVIIAGLFVFAGSVAEAGQAFSGTVKKVIDGESLLITAGGRNIEVQLYGVDTSEYNHPYIDSVL